MHFRYTAFTMPVMEKRASWLELFYDVAFIALVAQLTYLAAEHHHSVRDLVHIGLVAYTIFVAWWATTANRNLQPYETRTEKTLVQLQMVGVFLMSVFMQSVFEGQYVGFFLTLGMVRLMQSVMIVRMYYYHPETRPVTYNLLEGFFAASALWLLTAFLPDPYYLVAASMALAIDVLVPLTRGRGNTKRYLNVYHLQERLGLFLMLVIGESMIVVALSNSVSGSIADQLGIVFSGLALMIAVWWLYFEHSDRHVGKRPRELFSFLHAHGLLYVSILLISVGYKKILGGAISETAYTFIVLGIAGIGLSLVLIRYALHDVYLRACSMLTVCILCGVGLIMYGYTSQQYVLAIILLTVVYSLVALADQRGLFVSYQQLRQPLDPVDQ